MEILPTEIIQNIMLYLSPQDLSSFVDSINDDGSYTHIFDNLNFCSAYCIIQLYANIQNFSIMKSSIIKLSNNFPSKIKFYKKILKILIDINDRYKFREITYKYNRCQVEYEYEIMIKMINLFLPSYFTENKNWDQILKFNSRPATEFMFSLIVEFPELIYDYPEQTEKWIRKFVYTGITFPMLKKHILELETIEYNAVFNDEFMIKNKIHEPFDILNVFTSINELFI